MRKVTFIGGGSAKFISTLMRDMFSFPALQEVHVTLMDIDLPRAQRSERLLKMIIAQEKLPATVEATDDQRRALEGADYVIITIMVGGFPYYYCDSTIPMRYGVQPTVGDTIGPGAVFRLIRTQPVLQQIADNLRAVAPDAWVLNYSNPMAMNTLALLEAGQVKTVGLCHSIQGDSYRKLAALAGVPADEIDAVRYTAGGINHVNFYLTLEHNGQNLYPRILERIDEMLAEHPEELPRIELLRALGYFPAEGPYHQSEYYPWFRKNDATIAEYGVETMWGYNFDKSYNETLIAQVEAQLAGESVEEWTRSHEYGAHILNAMETHSPLLFYGNVRNEQLIDNLPQRAVVEVPCVADGTGITACHIGSVPTQLAAIQAQHIAVHQLALDGVQQRDRRLIRMAIQADPLTGAICTLPQIRELTEDMFAANMDYTTDWPA